MTLVKSHNCTKCGGTLIVHNDLQQYECPYCSVFYDYEYFRSRDILEQAAASQKMLQYDSAIEKYEFILKKDPQNFTAIRGKLLCESKINRPEELRKAEKMMQISLDSLMQAEKAVEPDGKPYFSQLLRLRMLARSQAALHDSEKRKKFDRSFAGIYDHLKMTDPKRIALQKNEEVLSEETQALVSMISSMSCTSCGGELIINLDRQLYECPFCGVTFDFDFVRDETAFSEAAEALSKKQFIKADGIYAYILKSDPKCYAAHRGRVLCAAKWTCIPSEMASEVMPQVHIPTLKARVEEAIALCEPEDRPYFELFLYMLPEYERLFQAASPRKQARQKLLSQRKDMEREYDVTLKKYENYKLKDTEDCGCLMYTEIEEMERLKGRLTGLSAGLQHIDNQLCELEESELCSNEQLWESKINMEKALADIRQWEAQRALNTGTAK